MFARLNQEKVMYFKDGKPALIYKDALKQLAIDIGQSDSSLVDLEKHILTAVLEATIALNSNKKLTAENNNILLAFYKWVQSIHNDNLAPPADARFPNNIIYDLLIMLRNQNNSTAQEILLHFFLEGANARKMSNGKTPDLDFISTALATDAVLAAKNLGVVLSGAAKQFLDHYNSLSNFSVFQKKLEAGCTKLKDDPLYAYLSAKETFNFKREKNETTGVNRYLIDEAVAHGVAVLTDYPIDVAAVITMLCHIDAVFRPLVSEFKKADEQSSALAGKLARWDASEWLSRIYTALSIAAHYSPCYEMELAIFMSSPFIAEIIADSKAGNFSAKMRNISLDAMELTELFSQQQLSTLAAAVKKAPLSFMWQMSNNNADKCKTVDIKITNGKTLTVEQGSFVGDREMARELIQDFCVKNTVTYQSHGHGYGALTVNDANHNITPYGIDLPMMLEFCGIKNIHAQAFKVTG